MRPVVFALLVIGVSCSSPAPEAKKSSPAPVATMHEPPKDLSVKFPSAGQTKMQLVPDHLLGKDFMPGGNLADYKTGAGTYQMFLIEAPSAQKAAFMLIDWHTAMPDAKYLAHMGGYSGTTGGKAVYVFSKGPYVAGVVGLPEVKADLEARRFAARL